jgi:hypothetical protein
LSNTDHKREFWFRFSHLSKLVNCVEFRGRFGPLVFLDPVPNRFDVRN